MNEQILRLFLKYLNEDYNHTDHDRAFQSLKFIIENKSQISVLKLDWNRDEHDLELVIFKAFLNCKEYLL